jgi:hypothetical protein
MQKGAVDTLQITAKSGRSRSTAATPSSITAMLRLILGILASLCALSQCTQQVPLSDISLSASTDKYLSRAQKLMKATPMIDGHNVPPPLLSSNDNNRTYQCCYDF